MSAYKSSEVSPVASAHTAPTLNLTPAAKPATVRPTPAPAQAATPAVRGRVLLVDDEPALQRAYGRVLRAAGFQVEVAGDGKAAFEMVRSQSFDCVVSDISMPQLDGLQMLKAVRERDADLPVILMTGRPAVSSAVQALEFGALRYLVKPVEASALTESVQQGVHLRQVARIQREAARLFGTTATRARAELELRFERALVNLQMAFQPIVSWSKRQVYGYEALVRTLEPTLARPDQLFAAAEDLGRVADLGRKIRSLVADAVEHLPPNTYLFCNLNLSDLGDDELYSPRSALAPHADRVVLEITERTSFDRMGDLRARFDRLREQGFRIALDDLGAGYASLSTFVQLQPEIVKIDMSLVRDLHNDFTKQSLVRTITHLCSQLGITVIAEGVETEEERAALVDLGADLLQGYFFARPGRPFPEVNWGEAQQPAAPAPLLALVEPAPAPTPGPFDHEAQLTEVSLATARRLRLLDNLSHELRTPLNAIIGFAHLLYDGKAGALTPAQQEALSDILASGQSLQSLIDEVLTPPVDISDSPSFDSSDIDNENTQVDPLPMDVAEAS